MRTLRTVLPWLFALGALGACALPTAEQDAVAGELRCGWFENPTPGNAWLVDGDGLWLIAAQGAHQAEGDWPSFAPERWVSTNGHYGYGCACVQMVVDPVEQTVQRILSSHSQSLESCRSDPALTEPALE
jgi:hypothetical protein